MTTTRLAYFVPFVPNPRTTLSDTTARITVRHFCAKCGVAMEAGASVRKVVTVTQGRFNTNHFHLTASHCIDN